MAARALAAAGLVLLEGSEVVARVLEAPAGGGRGLLSLAGRRVPAQLPAGLHAGERLRLTVEAQGSDTVLLRIVRSADSAEAADRSSARLAGALAVSGDPDLLRVALALAGGVLVLPGGAGASLEVDPEAARPGGRDGEPARARITLHSPELGAIEIVLALAASSTSAVVRVEHGRPWALAREASAELVEALERSTGRPSGVTVAPRGPAEPRPAPPAELEVIDVRA